MRPNEITVLRMPEPNPQATTGDGQAPTELFVGWPGVPTEQDKLEFQKLYTLLAYDTFHASNWKPTTDADADDSRDYESAQ